MSTQEDDRGPIRHVKEKSLVSLKTHLPELFRAMSDFSYAAARMYKKLVPRNFRSKVKACLEDVYIILYYTIYRYSMYNFVFPLLIQVISAYFSIHEAVAKTIQKPVWILEEVNINVYIGR
ncbi:hypothetical protein FRX31_029561 [Thalictrum thalictroides]|uniref:Uncharacterized protein n=1 Tax=Thalictrum thalictroides TaxID=46969 RepID=A0A7J6V9F5_THATH|nr:hypothetical protein FRX31_029561 [Thalictrum thalictroides]